MIDSSDPRYAKAVEAATAAVKQGRWYAASIPGEKYLFVAPEDEARDVVAAFLAALAEEGVVLTDTREGKHSVQRDIEDFHRVVVGIPDSTTPAIRRPELRAELIREEAQETVDAILRGDLVEAIDGLCDILAVTYGTAAEFGINLAPFWAEVHRTNMAKAGGPLRADGKRLKPEGWQPPDIAGILEALPEPEPLKPCADCPTHGACMDHGYCPRVKSEPEPMVAVSEVAEWLEENVREGVGTALHFLARFGG